MGLLTGEGFKGDKTFPLIILLAKWVYQLVPFIKNFELFPTREWAWEPRALAPVNRGENM
jgi:hypothetical protein